MLSMPTNGLPSLIPATRTSRRVFSCSALATAVLLPPLLSRLMSTRRLTRPLVLKARPVPSGEALLPKLLLAVLLLLRRALARTGPVGCPT